MAEALVRCGRSAAAGADPGQQPQGRRGLLPRPRPDRRRRPCCGSSTSSTRSARPGRRALLVELGRHRGAGRGVPASSPRSRRTDASFVDRVRALGVAATRCSTRGWPSWPRWSRPRAEHAPGVLRRRPEDRPRARLLHRHRLRDAAGRATSDSARSAPAAATTRWPATADDLPGRRALDRRVPARSSRLLSRRPGRGHPVRCRPACWSRCRRGGAGRVRRGRGGAAARGIPVEVAPRRRQVRQADPARRAAGHPVRLVPARVHGERRPRGADIRSGEQVAADAGRLAAARGRPDGPGACARTCRPRAVATGPSTALGRLVEHVFELGDALGRLQMRRPDAAALPGWPRSPGSCAA